MTTSTTETLPAASDPTAQEATAPISITLHVEDAWSTISTLQAQIGGLEEWGTTREEEAASLRQLATNAAILAHLASAAAAYRRQGDRRPEIARTPAALREQLQFLLMEESDPDPAIVLSAQDMDGFVFSLLEALSTFDRSRLVGYTEEAGMAHYHLSRLARALETAANAAGAFTWRRVDDLRRLANLQGTEAPATADSSAPVSDPTPVSGDGAATTDEASTAELVVAFARISEALASRGLDPQALGAATTP